MKIALSALLVVGLIVGSFMTWQHVRYLRVRRDLVHDRQSILHSSAAFHTVTFLRVRPGDDVIDEVRALKQATEGADGTWIYAGKAIVGRTSAQIGDRNWSAVVVRQYPSREAYDRDAQSEALRAALDQFDETYTQGFRRWPAVSAMVPQGLLALRATQVLSGQPSHFPFEPAGGTLERPEAQEMASRLLAEKELGADAVLVVNLIKHGSSEEQEANSGYGRAMLGAMAEGGYGPMHLGEAVRVEGDYDFDQVVLVFYPGVQFFADMVQSQFFQGIIGGKQLGDTQAIITAPILDS